MNRRPPVTEGRTGDAAPGRLTVRLHDVTVHFPRRRDPVLSVADLELSAGERLLVLGPSGAGKSTLLDVLSGVVPHTVTSELRGEVAVCGRATPDTSVVELSRHIAVLGQDPVAGVCLPTVELDGWQASSATGSWPSTAMCHDSSTTEVSRGGAAAHGDLPPQLRGHRVRHHPAQPRRAACTPAPPATFARRELQVGRRAAGSRRRGKCTVTSWRRTVSLPGAASPVGPQSRGTTVHR